MKRKILIITLAAAVLVVAAVGGTLAYLTANAMVENTFTVGHITMTLLEAPVDTDGKATTGARIATGNSYKIIPGAEFDKDPQVTIKAGSEPCYVFVKIDNEINNELTGAATLNISSDWTLISGSTDVYQYTGTSDNIVDALTADRALTKVFTTITISGSVVNSTNITNLADKEIIVTAYAHQSANTNESAAKDAALAFFTPAS